MTYLLDTHALVWFMSGDSQLSARARILIDDEANELYFSVAGLWEIAIKYSLGKLNLHRPFDELFPAQLELNSINVLDISVEHLKTVCKLPFHHRDPFDRLIVAQSVVENLPIISTDAVLDRYSVNRLW